jgi:hypothetical protein
MNIDQLPNGLQELARKRRSEERNLDLFTDENNLVTAFEWKHTKEDHNFWETINDAEFDVYKEKYPTHNWTYDYPDEYGVVFDWETGEGIVVTNPAYAGRKIHEEAEGLAVTTSVLASGYYAGEGVSQAVKDAWMHGYEYANRLWCGDIPPPITEGITRGVTAECARFIYEDGSESEVFKIPSDSTDIVDGVNLTGGSGEVLGIKEDDGKLSYELDWEFIEAMAVRMSKNKSKYEPYNWKKPIEVEQLKQAIVRHVVEIMKGNYIDDKVELGHIIALSCNAQMLFYQLNNYKD